MTKTDEMEFQLELVKATARILPRISEESLELAFRKAQAVLDGLKWQERETQKKIEDEHAEMMDRLKRIENEQ